MGACRRCQGLMVPSFTDSLFLEVAEAVQGPSWRCVNCGEWLDDTILSNRLRVRRASSSSPKASLPLHERRWNAVPVFTQSRRFGINRDPDAVRYDTGMDAGERY